MNSYRILSCMLKPYRFLREKLISCPIPGRFSTLGHISLRSRYIQSIRETRCFVKNAAALLGSTSKYYWVEDPVSVDVTAQKDWWHVPFPSLITSLLIFTIIKVIFTGVDTAERKTSGKYFLKATFLNESSRWFRNSVLCS